MLETPMTCLFQPVHSFLIQATMRIAKLNSNKIVFIVLDPRRIHQLISPTHLYIEIPWFAGKRTVYVKETIGRHEIWNSNVFKGGRGERIVSTLTRSAWFGYVCNTKPKNRGKTYRKLLVAGWKDRDIFSHPESASPARYHFRTFCVHRTEIWWEPFAFSWK